MTAWITLQVLINVGAVVGVLPITGVPLPLISFGGTSLLVSLAGLGLVASVARRGSSRRARRADAESLGARPRRRRRERRPRLPGLWRRRRSCAARGHDVEFAGGDRLEARVVPEAGFAFHALPVRRPPSVRIELLTPRGIRAMGVDRVRRRCARRGC